jgi:hypothetical protein
VVVATLVGGQGAVVRLVLVLRADLEGGGDPQDQARTESAQPRCGQGWWVLVAGNDVELGEHGQSVVAHADAGADQPGKGGIVDDDTVAGQAVAGPGDVHVTVLPDVTP